LLGRFLIGYVTQVASAIAASAGIVAEEEEAEAPLEQQDGTFFVSTFIFSSVLLQFVGELG
jgi:hypothetical protein